jgi:predicted esterase
VSLFKDTLTAMSDRSDNDYFKLHCQSIIYVIDTKTSLSSVDTGFIQAAYEAFNNTIDTIGSPKKLSSYLNRIHPFILAWKSLTDGETSLTWLKPPKDWNPSKKYPLYIQLHGNWAVADNIIDYLTWPFLQDPSSSFAFEDGYYLAPWGRGNDYSYRGISETDIWECIDVLHKKVQIDPARRYICGHSRGGNGTAYIGYRSAKKWAALGLHAAAITNDLLEDTVCNELVDMPIYFVYGSYDGYIEVGQIFYDLLYAAGNREMEFVTFEGGHDYRQEDVESMYLWMRQYTTSIQETSVLTTDFISYPNPFQNTTHISYTLSASQNLRIEIFNSFGQPVKLLVNKTRPAGNYIENWTPGNLPSGIYYYRISISNNTITRKLIYNK